MLRRRKRYIQNDLPCDLMRIYSRGGLEYDLAGIEILLKELKGAEVRVVLEYEGREGKPKQVRDAGILTFSYPEREEGEFGLLTRTFGIIPTLASYCFDSLRKLYVPADIEIRWLKESQTKH
jgi:hypothetical protein